MNGKASAMKVAMNSPNMFGRLYFLRRRYLVVQYSMMELKAAIGIAKGTRGEKKQAVMTMVA